MKSFHVVSFISTLLLLSACNSGGARRVVGKQCPVNYSVSMVPKGNEVLVSLDPAAKQLTPGYYTYQSATAYFQDKTNDFRVEVIDSKNSKSQKDKTKFEATANCVRNAKGGLMLSFETVGVSKIEVTPDFKTFYDVRSYGVTVVPGSMKATSSTKQEKVEAAPGKAYENVADVILLKKNATDYELRSAFEDQSKKVFLVVRLKWSKDAPPAPQAAVKK